MENLSDLNFDFQFWEGAKPVPAQVVERRLSSLAHLFQDQAAAAQQLLSGDPLLYEVDEYDPGSRPGDMKIALTHLYPGKVGREYYMTKGHFHDPLEDAEVYYTLSGAGKLLLQDHQGHAEWVDMRPGAIVYIPGGKAHRTINTGDRPLVFVGIYPARTGHDYHIKDCSWYRKILVEQDGKPSVVDNPSCPETA